MSNGRSGGVSSNSNSRVPQRTARDGHESKVVVGYTRRSYKLNSLTIPRSRARSSIKSGAKWCKMGSREATTPGRPRMKYKRVSDAFDELCSAGGILLTAAPEEYLNGDFEGDTPLSNGWSDSVDAMMHACIEVEKLLTLLADKAGLRPPDSNHSEPDDQSVASDQNPDGA